MVRRIVGSVILSLAVVGLVGSVTLADEPADTDGSGNGCQGVRNAYAHAAEPALPALQAVAEKHGCDLSDAQRVAKPDHPDKPDVATDQDDHDNTAGEDLDDGPDVEKKCDKIGAKLEEAEARPHGKSADAFSRQADHWGCDSN